MFHRYLSCIVPCTCANAAIPIPVNTTSQHRHPPSQADESQCQKPISGFPRGVLYTKRLQETLQQERKAAMASMKPVPGPLLCNVGTLGHMQAFFAVCAGHTVWRPERLPVYRDTEIWMVSDIQISNMVFPNLVENE